MDKQRKSGWMRHWPYLILSIAVTIGYDACYGLFTLLPSNVDWLMTVYHDWGQHYLGYAFFAHEPWQFPLGHIDHFNYPAGTNVGYTDSIPIAAILAKLFSFIWPTDGQYFGLWLWSSHLFVGVLAFKLFRYFRLNMALSLLAAFLVSFNPVLLYRGIHPALCTHWLFLISLYFYVLQPTEASVHTINRRQVLILLLSASINPYLFLIVAGFSLIIPLRHYLVDRVLSLWQAVAYFVSGIVLVPVLWFIIGMVTIGNQVSMEVTNSYGLYGFNLNSFFDTGGFSPYMSDLDSYNVKQYEGYAYLGLGIMFLIIGALIAFLINPGYRGFKTLFQKKWIPLIALAVGMALFAITNTVTWGDQLLFQFPIPGIVEKLGSVFRASGRFIWVFYYLMIIVSVLLLDRAIKQAWVKTLAMVLLIILQLADTRIFFSSKNFEAGAYQPEPIHIENWQTLVAPFDLIVTYPPFNNNLHYQSDYQDLCFVALRENKPITSGYVARETTAANNKYLDSLNARLLSGDLVNEELFVTTNEHLDIFKPLIYHRQLELNYLDGYCCLIPVGTELGQGLSWDSNSDGRVDSVLRTTAKMAELRPVEAPGFRSEAVQMGIEHKSHGPHTVHLQGWAFAQNTSDNTGDTVMVYLTSASRSYRVPSKSAVRKDVTSHFERENLDNSGFSTTFITDNIPPGTYKLAVVIKDAQDELHASLLPGNNEVVVSKSLKPKKALDIPVPKGRLIYNVEQVNTSVGGEITINGWAAIQGRDAVDPMLSVLFCGANDSLELRVDAQGREDVTAYFNATFDYDASGFQLTMDGQDLPSGQYRIGLLVAHTDGTRDAVLTDEYLTVD